MVRGVTLSFTIRSNKIEREKQDIIYTLVRDLEVEYVAALRFGKECHQTQAYNALLAAKTLAKKSI